MLKPRTETRPRHWPWALIASLLACQTSISSANDTAFDSAACAAGAFNALVDMTYITDVGDLMVVNSGVSATETANAHFEIIVLAILHRVENMQENGAFDAGLDDLGQYQQAASLVFNEVPDASETPGFLAIEDFGKWVEEDFNRDVALNVLHEMMFTVSLRHRVINIQCRANAQPLADRYNPVFIEEQIGIVSGVFYSGHGSADPINMIEYVARL